jgi:hypothetical protein
VAILCTREGEFAKNEASLKKVEGKKLILKKREARHGGWYMPVIQLLGR